MKPSDTFLLPGESLDWEVWSINGSKKGKLRNKVAGPEEIKKIDGMVIGLPATRCRTLGLQLPATDRSVLGDMVYAQLEKRGLGNAYRENCIFQVHVVDEQPDRSLVSVDVLPPDFPDELCFTNAGGYTSASRLLPLPKGKLSLWIERGRLILAANRGGRLIYSQAIGADSDITASVAKGIALTILSLEGEGLVTDFDGLVVWGRFPAEQIALLKEHVPLRIEVIDRPEPGAMAGTATTPVSGDLVPVQVIQARAAAARRKKIAVITVLALTVYALVAVFVVLYVKKLEDEAVTLRNEIARTTPLAEMIRATQARWAVFQPVVNVERFALIQLNELTKMLPPGGLVLRKFEARPDRLEVDGSARDPQIAFQFLEDIKKSPLFDGFTWKMGQPKVNNEDKTATFEIIGTFGEAGS